MLGETQGTSAGGAAEAGKFLRVPGTNPFFPLPHELQGNRFLELMDDSPIRGLPPQHRPRRRRRTMTSGSKKVRSRTRARSSRRSPRARSSGSATPTSATRWRRRFPGIDDAEILQPRRLYERQGRGDEYAAIVERFKRERVEYLDRYPGLKPEIAAAVR